MRASFLLPLACCAGALCTASLAAPATTTNANTADGEWVEAEVAPPPRFDTEKLIAVDMPPHTSVRYGVDPATIAIGPDSVVRYVVVMRNASNSASALFEGIRCSTKEVKTYARWSQASAGWTPLAQAPWRYWNDNMPSRHAMALARQGVCENYLPGASPEAIARSLRQPSKVPSDRALY